MPMPLVADMHGPAKGPEVLEDWTIAINELCNDEMGHGDCGMSVEYSVVELTTCRRPRPSEINPQAGVAPLVLAGCYAGTVCGYALRAAQATVDGSKDRQVKKQHVSGRRRIAQAHRVRHSTVVSFAFAAFLHCCTSTRCTQWTCICTVIAASERRCRLPDGEDHTLSGRWADGKNSADVSPLSSAEYT